MSADDQATTTEPDAVVDVEPDELREGLVARLRAALGDDLVDHHVWPGVDAWVRVRPTAWARAAQVAHDQLGCRYFTFLSAVDWKPSPFGRGEDDPTEPTPERSTEIEQGVTGGDTRYQLVARVANVVEHFGINLKTDVPDDSLAVETWTGVYAGADWHEREVWEMFGITFEGHPGLRNIYLPTEFEGHPLRKDFPLLARMVKPWPGIVDVEPMPAEPEEAADEAPTPDAGVDEGAAASDARGKRETEAHPEGTAEKAAAVADADEATAQAEEGPSGQPTDRPEEGAS